MLDVQGVNAGYGRAVVLHDIDLSVSAGQVVSLLGPNGVGKTTLLRTVSGLLPCMAGSVHIDGRDVTGRAPNARASLGLCHIPEGRSIYPSLTVRENIRLFAKSVHDGAAVDRAVDAFPVLKQKLATVAGQLSGGQQQMLALTRAYVRAPRLVLVDEASMGLAPIVVDEIFAFLSKLSRTGVALLIVEQYIARALKISDHVYLMNKGAVVFSGPPSAVTDDVYEHYISVRPASAVSDTGR